MEPAAPPLLVVVTVLAVGLLDGDVVFVVAAATGAATFAGVVVLAMSSGARLAPPISVPVGRRASSVSTNNHARGPLEASLIAAGL